jgi:hypothetical protein
VLCAGRAGEVFVGKDPVVHVVAHDVGVEEIKVTDLHPDADGLGARVGDEVLVEFPGGHFGSGEVRRAEDEVAVSIGKRQCAVGEFFRLDVAGGAVPGVAILRLTIDLTPETPHIDTDISSSFAFTRLLLRFARS